MDDTTGTARWPLGCQARPWLQTLGMDAFRDDLPGVMRSIADAGFAGFETALPALPLDDPDTFAGWRDAAGGLRLAAAHAGGEWWGPAAGTKVEQTLSLVAGLPGLGCDRLMVSVTAGVTDLDGAGLAELATTLGRLADGAAARGVAVSIHNHAHELRDDARILRAIVSATDPAHVSLGADIGWVVAGGWDPIAFLDSFGDRVGYLHLRDVRREGDRTVFVEVGRGDIDWSAVVGALRTSGYAGWLTAESEFTADWRGETDPATTAAAQHAGLSRLLA